MGSGASSKEPHLSPRNVSTTELSTSKELAAHDHCPYMFSILFSIGIR